MKAVAYLRGLQSKRPIVKTPHSQYVHGAMPPGRLLELNFVHRGIKMHRHVALSGII